MKYILLVIALLLNACDNSSPTPKIAAPQREALEKAKGVDQVVQKGAEDTQNKAKEAEGY
jgi:outer membrane PBP1 activator LpoA protein